MAGIIDHRFSALVGTATAAATELPFNRGDGASHDCESSVYARCGARWTDTRRPELLCILFIIII